MNPRVILPLIALTSLPAAGRAQLPSIQELDERLRAVEQQLGVGGQRPVPTIGVANKQWQLTLADEFSAAALDGAKWSPKYFWTPTVINGELQDYFPDQLKLADGLLKIRCDAPQRAGGRYRSGVISSFGKFSQAYGFFEVRLKWPSGPGTWPTFWLYPEDRKWPPEIDIFEANGYKPRLTWPNYHWTVGGKQQADPTYFDAGVDLTADFHVYSLLWQPGLLVWYLDGREIKRLAGEHVASKPMHINLNLAIAPPGNAGMPTPDATTKFPCELEIDYVRVWK